MRARSGGAVSVVGNVNVQLIRAASLFMQGLFEAAYTEGASTVGEALRRAVLKMPPRLSADDSRLSPQGNMLLGDPALPMPSLGAPVVATLPPRTAGAQGLSRTLTLRIASPNPASQPVRLEFDLPASLAASPCIEIIDVSGRRVRLLESQAGPASGTSEWDLRGASGRRAPGGLYFVRLTAGSQSLVKRVIVAP